MDAIIVILLLGAMILFWWDSVGAKEQARQTGRALCERNDVQFLDDTVALNRITLRRNSNGQLCFYRIFKFEFSSDNYDRYSGRVYMLGKQQEKTEMDAYPFSEE